MTPICYREYWDVPRLFVAVDSSGTYLLDCAFDEQIDDYPEYYEVFAMPPLSDDAFAGSWRAFPGCVHIGRVRVSEVRFDASHRQQVDLDGLRRLLRP